MLHESIISAVFDRTPRNFDVELWNGRNLERIAVGPAAAGCLVVRTPAAVSRLAPPLDERAVAEAFLDGMLDIVGDTVAVLEAIVRWQGPRVSIRALPLVALAWAGVAVSRARDIRLSRPRHSVPRDARAVQQHYDLSDDFYRSWTSGSCTPATTSLAAMSRLMEPRRRSSNSSVESSPLSPEEQLLDVGCGWGALLLYAVQRFGVRATGTTISRHRFLEAQRRAGAAGVGSHLRVLDCDYRRLPEDPADKIVSLGMMEHVGGDRLDEYFSHVPRRFAPGRPAAQPSDR